MENEKQDLIKVPTSKKYIIQCLKGDEIYYYKDIDAWTEIASVKNELDEKILLTNEKIDSLKISITVDGETQEFSLVDAFINLETRLNSKIEEADEAIKTLHNQDKAAITNLITEVNKKNEEYEILNSDAVSLIDYNCNEIRVLCNPSQKNEKIKFRAYGPEFSKNAVYTLTGKDGSESRTNVDNLDTSVDDDDYHRKYIEVELKISDDLGYLGSASTDLDFVGWFFTVIWKDSKQNILKTDKIRINLAKDIDNFNFIDDSVERPISSRVDKVINDLENTNKTIGEVRGDVDTNTGLINELNAAKESLNTNIKGLESKDNELSDRISSLESSVGSASEGSENSLSSRISTLEDVIGTSTNENSVINRLDSLENKDISIATDISALKTKDSSIDGAIAGIESEISTLKNKNTAIEGSIEGINSNITLINENVNTKATASSLTNLADEFSAYKTTHATEISSKITELDNSKVSNENYNSKVEELSGYISSINSKIGDISSDKSLKSLLEESAENIDTLNDSIVSINASIAAINEIYSTDEEMNTAIADLLDKVKNFEGEFELLSKISKNEADISSIKTSLDDENSGIKVSIDAIRGDITNINNTSAETKTRIETEIQNLKNTRVVDISNAKLELNNRISETKELLESSITSNTTKIETISTSLTTNTTGLTEAKNNISELKTITNNLKNKVENDILGNGTDSLKTKIEGLGTQISENRNAIESSLSTSKTELKNLIDTNKDDISSLKNRVKTVEGFSSDISDLEASNTKINSDIESLKTSTSVLPRLNLDDVNSDLNKKIDKKIEDFVNNMSDETETKIKDLVDYVSKNGSALEGFLTDSKAYTDEELAKLNTSLSERITDNNDLVTGCYDYLGNMEERFNVGLRTIEENMVTNSEFDTVSTTVDSLTENISSLNNSISELTSKTKSLEGSDDEIKSDIQSLESRVETSETNIGNLTTAVNTLSEGMLGIDGKIEVEVKDTLNNSEYITTLVDNVVGEKVETTLENSVGEIVDNKINDFANKISDDGTINTFKELVDYVAENGTTLPALEQGATHNDSIQIKGADENWSESETYEGVKGTYSNGAVALAQYSTTKGQNSFTTGRRNKALNNQAVAMGQSNTASGKYSVALNGGTNALADYSTAINCQNYSLNNHSFVGGYQNVVSGFASFMHGHDNSESYIGYNETQQEFFILNEYPMDGYAVAPLTVYGQEMIGSDSRISFTDKDGVTKSLQLSWETDSYGNPIVKYNGNRSLYKTITDKDGDKWRIFAINDLTFPFLSAYNVISGKGNSVHGKYNIVSGAQNSIISERSLAIGYGNSLENGNSTFIEGKGNIIKNSINAIVNGNDYILTDLNYSVVSGSSIVGNLLTHSFVNTTNINFDILEFANIVGNAFTIHGSLRYSAIFGKGHEIQDNTFSLVSGENNKVLNTSGAESGVLYNTVLGKGNTVNSSYASLVGGKDNIAHTSNSIILGEGLITYSKGSIQSILGKHNKKNSEAIFIVGNGDSDSVRSNALEVYYDGTVLSGKSTSDSDSGKVLVTKDFLSKYQLIDENGILLNKIPTSVNGVFDYSLNIKNNNKTFSFNSGTYVTELPLSSNGNLGSLTYTLTESSFGADNKGAVALGTETYAHGKNSFTAGKRNTARHNQAVAMGQGNRALGKYSIALNASNIVTNDYSAIFGSDNTNLGGTSFMAGTKNFTGGNGITTFGKENIDAYFVIDSVEKKLYLTTTKLSNTMALTADEQIASCLLKDFNPETKELGVTKNDQTVEFHPYNGSLSFVYNDKTYYTSIDSYNNPIIARVGDTSAARYIRSNNGRFLAFSFYGDETFADLSAHTLINGKGNKTAETRYSSIFGRQNITKNLDSVIVAGISNNVSNCMGNIVGGYSNTLNGYDFVLMSGYKLEASSDYQTVLGHYNDISDDSILFMVGNGTETTRKNAISVHKDGSVKVFKRPEKGRDVIRLEDIKPSTNETGNSITISAVFSDIISWKPADSICSVLRKCDIVDGAQIYGGADTNGLKARFDTVKANKVYDNNGNDIIEKYNELETKYNNLEVKYNSLLERLAAIESKLTFATNDDIDLIVE